MIYYAKVKDFDQVSFATLLLISDCRRAHVAFLSFSLCLAVFVVKFSTTEFSVAQIAHPFVIFWHKIIAGNDLLVLLTLNLVPFYNAIC